MEKSNLDLNSINLDGTASNSQVSDNTPPRKIMSEAALAANRANAPNRQDPFCLQLHEARPL